MLSKPQNMLSCNSLLLCNTSRSGGLQISSELRAAVRALSLLSIFHPSEGTERAMGARNRFSPRSKSSLHHRPPAHGRGSHELCATPGFIGCCYCCCCCCKQVSLNVSYVEGFCKFGCFIINYTNNTYRKSCVCWRVKRDFLNSVGWCIGRR